MRFERIPIRVTLATQFAPFAEQLQMHRTHVLDQIAFVGHGDRTVRTGVNPRLLVHGVGVHGQAGHQLPAYGTQLLLFVRLSRAHRT